MSLGSILDRLGLPRRAAAVVDRIGVLQPLRVRDFAFLWTGLAVSFVGDGIYIIAIAGRPTIFRTRLLRSPPSEWPGACRRSCCFSGAGSFPTASIVAI